MQIFLNGLISGLVIALLAVAFQMIYVPTRILFFGLAGLYVLAPYVCWACRTHSVTSALSAAAAVFASVLVALATEKFNHGPLERKGASSGAHLISSLGVYIVLVQFVAIVWGNDTKTLRTGIDSTATLGGGVLTGSQVWTAGVAIVLLAGFVATLHGTNLGLRLRALADNPDWFALCGYDAYAYRLVAFGVAGLFAATAALLTAREVGFDPYTGLPAVLLAVVAVIVGGRSSFLGPIFGGLLLGVLRAQTVWYLSARWQEVLTFGLLALFLLARPQGLFRQKSRVEAAL